MDEKLTTNNQFSKPKPNGMSHIFLWQLLCYLLNPWSDTLASNTECVCFSSYWACKPCSLAKYRKTLSSEYSGWEKLLKPLDINIFRIESIIMDFMFLDTTTSNKGANAVLFPHPPCTAPKMSLPLFDSFFCLSVLKYTATQLSA